MIKKVLLVLVLGFVVTLSACTGISQSEYDALMAEKDVLVGEKATLQDELDSKMVGYKDQSVEAYKFTHSGYVGQVKIVVVDGVVDVEINEAFLPHTLAEVELSTLAAPTDWNETNTLIVGSSSYALYISYNDSVFKAVKTEAGLLVYTATDELGDVKAAARGVVTNLEMDIIKDDSAMSAYYEALTTGGFKLLKTFGDTTPIVISEYQFKDGNPNYWKASISSLGWQGNIDLIETFLEENGAAFDSLEFTKVLMTIDGLEDNYWQIGDIVTGATNSDFQDYFQLAQAAFGQLETQVK